MKSIETGASKSIDKYLGLRAAKVNEILADDRQYPYLLLEISQEDEIDMERVSMAFDNIIDSETRETNEWEMIKQALFRDEPSLKAFFRTSAILLALRYSNTAPSMHNRDILILLSKNENRMNGRPTTQPIEEKAYKGLDLFDAYDLFTFANLVVQLEDIKTAGNPKRDNLLKEVLPLHASATDLKMMVSLTTGKSQNELYKTLIPIFIENNNNVLSKKVLQILSIYLKSNEIVNTYMRYKARYRKSQETIIEPPAAYNSFIDGLRKKLIVELTTPKT